MTPERRSGPSGEEGAAHQKSGHHAATAAESTPHRRQDPAGLRQPTLDDALAEGRALRDEGTQTALDAAHLVARSAAEAVIDELAASGEPFAADDVHVRVGGPLGCRPAVMGALFRAAARAGTIECVGYRPSTRASRHAGIVRVWRGVT